MRFRSCFRAVDSTVRSVAKSRAPCADQNPREIFIVPGDSCNPLRFVPPKRNQIQVARRAKK